MDDILKKLGLQKDEVRLINYNPVWKEMYIEESELILMKCSKNILAVEHIGSTYITSIKSKPIIDIMLGIKDYSNSNDEIPLLKEIGYECFGEYGIPGRLFFKKVYGLYTTHHLHLCEFGKKFWIEHLLFRDYLVEHPKFALEYQQLKEKLTNKFKNDRNNYTKSKDSFIDYVLKLAKEKEKNEKI